MSPWIRLAVFVAISLMSCRSIGATGAADQDNAANRAKADAAIQKVLADCQVSDTETDPKKVNKQADCVARAVAAQRKRMAAEGRLRSTFNQLYIAPAPAPTPPPTPVRLGAAPPGPAPEGSAPSNVGASASQAPSNVGASASQTPSTCGPGTGANNPLIRVHRLLMAPKDASDDFGYRLGRRYIIYQVTISNDNKDYQYLIHDVSVDLSTLFHAEPGTYLYTASSQDLTLLRGVPEKGQDLDRRNLILHVLQGVGSVAGAVSGLTSFTDVLSSSAAVFNGPFLQSYVGIAPDHTATQLNRLSDSAYITNTLVEKQRARTIAMFVPEATVLSKADQKAYWKDPQAFLQGFDLNQADVCVDGAFVTTVAPPTLTAAKLAPKVPGTKLAAGVPATLTVQGSNLAAGDTQVVGLGTTVAVITTNGTSASVDVTLPPGYTAGMPVHLASAANPSVTSATVATTEAAQ